MRKNIIIALLSIAWIQGHTQLCSEMGRKYRISYL